MRKFLFISFLLVFQTFAGENIFQHLSEEQIFSKKSIEKGYLTFYLDNDLFVGEDSEYTNGTRVAWITRENIPEKNSIIRRVLDFWVNFDEKWMPLHNIHRKKNESRTSTYNKGLALTQLMYTPKDSQNLQAPSNERPYAGWLALSSSIYAKTESTLSSVEISIGATGRASLAKESQDVIHELWRVGKFKGWNSQVRSEVTLNIDMLQRRRLKFLEEGYLSQWSMDGYVENGLAIGNFQTAGLLGFMTRFGWNLPVDFSDPRISRTSNTLKMYRNKKGENTSAMYGLFGGRVYGVLHDITLDGSLFHNDNLGVNKKAIVGEIYAGLGVKMGCVELTYSQTYRTKEFKKQEDGNFFGSLALRWEF